MSINEITGDKLKSKPNSKEFVDNWERIFGKKNIAEGKKEALANAEEVRKSFDKALKKEIDSLCNICGKDLQTTQECAWTSCPLHKEK